MEYDGPSTGAIEFVRQEGLNAYEYQGTRGVRISEEKAEKLGENADKYDVWASIHAQYWINFASQEKETIEKSKDRLFKAARIGALMNAHQVVFHPAYYSDRSEKEAMELVIEGVTEVVDRLRDEKIEILVGPETSGKKSQLGSLDEIIHICQEVPMTAPTVDFAHIHARQGGVLENKEDYLKIFEKVESELGSEIAQNLHTHFTELKFTEKGEQKHLTYGTDYSPPFEPLAEVIVENGYTPVIISESPIRDKDALKYKKILEDFGYGGF